MSRSAALYWSMHHCVPLHLDKLNQAWNRKMLLEWTNKEISETHDVSAIDHFPIFNEDRSLAITTAGNIVFAKNENKLLVITGENALERRVLHKYRMIFDIYLLFEQCGYQIEEFLADECTACTTIPHTKSNNIVASSRTCFYMEANEDFEYESRPHIRDGNKLKCKKLQREATTKKDIISKIKTKRIAKQERKRKENCKRFDRDGKQEFLDFKNYGAEFIFDWEEYCHFNFYF
jgi:hypothetical protein